MDSETNISLFQTSFYTAYTHIVKTNFITLTYQYLKLIQVTNYNMIVVRNRVEIVSAYTVVIETLQTISFFAYIIVK